jgi:hypothetical protein
MCNDEEMTDKLVVLTPEDIFDLGRAVNVATVAGTSRLSPERSAQLQQALAAAVPAGPRYLLVARDSNSDGRDTLEIVTAASYCHLLPGADRQAVAKLETFATAPSAATVTDLAHARARLRGEQGERS